MEFLKNDISLKTDLKPLTCRDRFVPDLHRILNLIDAGQILSRCQDHRSVTDVLGWNIRQCRQRGCVPDHPKSVNWRCAASENIEDSRPIGRMSPALTGLGGGVITQSDSVVTEV